MRFKQDEKNIWNQALFYSQEQLNEQLNMLKEYKDEELRIVSEYGQTRYELESRFSGLIRRTKESNLVSELSAYQSSAKSIAKFLGMGIKEQALVMIPFEIAEATKEMAQFLATRDPSHLAASLKHTLAVKQYAEAARTSAPGGGAVSGGGHIRGAEAGRGTPAEIEREKSHRALVVVNVGDGIVINPKEFTRQLVEGLNEAYRDNVRIEFA